MHLRKNEIAACACIAAGVMLALLVGSGEFSTDLSPVPVSGPAATAASTATPQPTPTPEPTPVVETIRFSATGDNLIHEGLYNQAKARAGGEGYDFTYAYENMRDFYAQFDVNWLNQETLVNNDYAPSGYPCFSTPGDITNALYDIGFRVYSLSNNHSYDKGAGGIESSMAHWDAMPDDVVTAGFYDLESYDNLSYQTVNGITIGYLSYTEHTNGLNTPSGSQYGVVYLSQTDIIEQQIAAMRPNCDVLVVSCHWGVEGSHTVTDAQRQMAQWLADQGADLIIGTHPHVTQTAEWLTAQDGRQAFVAYSLGNFISAQSEADNMIGVLLDITFQKTTQPDGTVTVELLDPKLHPTVTQYESAYSNIRVYLFDDYTDELGAAHGNFSLSRDYIQSVLNESVGEEFLA